MRKLFYAFIAVVALATPALASTTCGVTSAGPYFSLTSENARLTTARSFLPFVLAVDGPSGSPSGFERTLEVDRSAFHAAAFVNSTTRTVVVAIDNLSAGDLLVAGVRRLVHGGASPHATDFVAEVLDTYPGYHVFLTAHSGGGQMASVVAAEFELPVVVYNAGRSPAAIASTDTGCRLVVVVRGDPIGDPGSGPGIPGSYLYLEIAENPPRNLHDLDAVQLALR